jgi:LDH2 family malate/lactate/ureidoglycolate dehydrogenase
MATRVPAAVLANFVTHALDRLGVPPPAAGVVAKGLIGADLLGLDSHGVAHFVDHVSYVPGIESGMVNPRAEITVTEASPALVMVDGDHGMGILAMQTALDAVMSRCAGVGLAVAWVRHSYHAGALAHFTRQGALQGFLTMAATNTRPSVAPTFGMRAALGTNAISVGVPYDEERVLLLDMATSAVAAGKLEVARREGRPIPLGWAIDREGLDTMDPADYFSGGALLPLGSTPELSSYKGYGLAVMVDVMTGLLSGMGHSLALPVHGHAHMVACLDVGRLMPGDAFRASVARMVDDLHAVPAVAGREVLVPGEREWCTYQDRSERGIPVSSPVLETLLGFARDRGLETDGEALSQYREGSR